MRRGGSEWPKVVKSGCEWLEFVWVFLDGFVLEELRLFGLVVLEGCEGVCVNNSARTFPLIATLSHSYQVLSLHKTRTR